LKPKLGKVKRRRGSKVKSTWADLFHTPAQKLFIVNLPLLVYPILIGYAGLMILDPDLPIFAIAELHKNTHFRPSLIPLYAVLVVGDLLFYFLTVAIIHYGVFFMLFFMACMHKEIQSSLDFVRSEG
jgi:hypothetical protein